MKVLALTILFIFAFFRIKNTPFALSKRIWKRKMVKQIQTLKEQNNNEPINEELKGAAILTMLLVDLFLIIFYIVLGSKIGTNEFIILSALQVLSCLWGLCISMSEYKSELSYNVEDKKFHRFYQLFKVILDYIYYPCAIYMLLK